MWKKAVKSSPRLWVLTRNGVSRAANPSLSSPTARHAELSWYVLREKPLGCAPTNGAVDRRFADASSTLWAAMRWISTASARRSLSFSTRADWSMMWLTSMTSHRKNWSPSTVSRNAAPSASCAVLRQAAVCHSPGLFSPCQFLLSARLPAKCWHATHATSTR